MDFISINELDQHIHSEHIGFDAVKKQFICFWLGCYAFFTNKEELEEHINHIHVDTMLNEEEEVLDDSLMDIDTLEHENKLLHKLIKEQTKEINKLKEHFNLDKVVINDAENDLLIKKDTLALLEEQKRLTEIKLGHLHARLSTRAQTRTIRKEEASKYNHHRRNGAHGSLNLIGCAGSTSVR
ncbi:11205_t:CDS:2 [Paraglomus brasilianum]|uniref:11205_t:CDS:1 n=1 Tax=Paraglomus brasilianum TaxID=144538 RepID=A0A9N8WKS1_9GLOM|nr:11205_t:CDS:2 [Paraglomus brasilianum]